MKKVFWLSLAIVALFGCEKKQEDISKYEDVSKVASGFLKGVGYANPDFSKLYLSYYNGTEKFSYDCKVSLAPIEIVSIVKRDQSYTSLQITYKGSSYHLDNKDAVVIEVPSNEDVVVWNNYLERLKQKRLEFEQKRLKKEQEFKDSLKKRVLPPKDE